MDDDEIDLEELLIVGDKGCVIIMIWNLLYMIYGNVGDWYFEFFVMDFKEVEEVIL